MVADLVNTPAAGHGIESLLFGGAPAPDWLAKGSLARFPLAVLYVPTHDEPVVVTDKCTQEPSLWLNGNHEYCDKLCR